PPARARLNLLYALLPELLQSGRFQATSRDLARWLGATPVTVRKDLSWLGTGTPGAAYDLGRLLSSLETFLEPRRALKTGLVGLGDEGLAVWSSLKKCPAQRYEMIVGFESRLNRLEQLELPFSLHPTTEIIGVCLRRGVEAAFLCVEPDEAQRCAERLVQGGVRYLVNYSSKVLRVNRHQVSVRECGVWAEVPELATKNEESCSLG
ncbi:MAG: hypothetical protein HKM06_08420, partial [Spirochaetales bacterium]|nr:hypothetical protein [Spirochaetales bacterium]